MMPTRPVLTYCMAVSLVLLAACGGEEEPATAVAEVQPTSAPTATVPAPEVGSADTLAYTFQASTELVGFEGRPSLKNPILVATDEGFTWGALVSSQGKAMWVVDGKTASLGDGQISDFVVSADLARYGYVSGDVVVVDGKQVDQGQTSCCPVFSEDGSRFGYVADGSFVVLDGAPQADQGDSVSQLTLSPDGSGHAYVVGGDTVVVDGENQKQYDSVSTLTFSPDGSRFAYIANDGVLVVDGEESEIEETTEGQIAFSPDGSRLAYVAGELKLGDVVLDEKVMQRYSFGCPKVFLRWACLTFTSDGSSLTYTTLVMGPSFGGESAGLTYRVVQDDEQQRGHFVGCCLIARPESAQVAYVSSRFFVVVNGQQVESAASSFSTAALAFGYSDRQHLRSWLIPADLVFGTQGGTLGFLLYETDVSPTSITKLYLETLDVP